VRTVLLLLAAAAAAAAQTIAVTGGIVSSQVVQREANGRAELKFSGTAAGSDGKRVEVKISGGLRNLFNKWRAVGSIADGKWEATLNDIQSGGPYKVEFRVEGTRDTVSIEPVFIGDLWILAGQSNMQGVGDLIDVERPDDRVLMLDMVQEKWQRAQEPLHNLVGAVDRVHWPLNAEKQPERYSSTKLDEYIRDRKKGAGLGLAFGAQYVRESGVPVGLIPCAHGGTSMDQWDPAKWDKDNPGDSLYGSMMRRFQVAGGRVKGVLWYQGESDANPAAATAYRQKFERFIGRVRQDMGDANLPFYYVQIGRHVSAANIEHWKHVQEDQRNLEASIPLTAVFSAIDVELDDGIHVGTQDLRRIGRSMALFASGKAKRGPRLRSAKKADNTIEVEFEDVNGKLASEGRVTGFSLRGPSGVEIPAIYKASIRGSSVILSTQGKIPDDAQLWYGYGKDPYCNLRDERGFGVLAMGPISIQ
jgi:sialate O-acetylesterase